MTVSAIVLAGGQSSRFGSPKLQALVDGVPLLDLAIGAAAEVADEVIVVGPAPGGKALTDLERIEANVRVELVLDPVAFGGPLLGLRVGLDAAAGGLAIVVGGDMPRLEPAVLRAMLARLSDSEVAPPESPNAPQAPESPALASPDAILLGQPGGGRPLPVALRVAEASRAVEAAIAAGETSLRAALARLTVAEMPEAEWRRLDPAGGSLLDVDTHADLDAARRA